ncbi:hypothetical protein [Natranaerofaba carboxydovora]|uniref:hypothetical protein n=1 Tax=Natranaerofaba carboxydovora TaxID=2742683 RepID=UPI001F1339C5|nr:hypothetical protein [Natranaerofaba carboxydovora]UMZ73607.1 hypothetical protein ACONDI_01169 [Natranaerofaba carboxydovora]
MTEKKDYKDLSIDELEEVLKEKQEDYQETEDMGEFLLKHTTNHHVPGYTHNNYVLKLEELDKEIKEIKKIIEEKKN